MTYPAGACKPDWENSALPPEIVGAILSIQAHFSEGAFDIVTGDVERLSGKPPRPLRDVLAKALAAV